MSADNFVAIVKRGKRYKCYHCCASHAYPYTKCYSCIGTLTLNTGKLKTAIQYCEKEYLEYGYTIPWEYTMPPVGGCHCTIKRMLNA